MVATGAATLCLALGLTACGGDSDSGDGKTIKLVAADYGDKASNASKVYWNQVKKEFEKANKGYEVDVQVINWNEIDKSVKNMIQAGDEPDLLQTGGYADKVADDLLYKADEVMSAKTRDNLIPTFAEAGEVDGTQYGIPWVSSSRVMFYNKDVFKKAYVKAPPKTWDELAAARRRSRTRRPPRPRALPLGPEETQGETMMWELGNGGGYTDGDGNTPSTAPERRDVRVAQDRAGCRASPTPTRLHRPQDGLRRLRGLRSACSTATRASSRWPRAARSTTASRPSPARKAR